MSMVYSDQKLPESLQQISGYFALEIYKLITSMKQPDSTTDTNNISNDHTDTMIIVKDVEGQMPKKYFKNILLSHY